MKIPTLTTDRLFLRPFTLQDVDALHSISSDRTVLRYFPRPEPPQRDRVERLIAQQLAHWDEHGYGWWALELRETPGLIGWCGLQFLSDFAKVEVAYLLGRDYWGRGLATEAARAAVHFGFVDLGLECIVGIAHVDNRASQRVITKLGMTLVEPRRLWDIECYWYELPREAFDGRR